MALTFSRAFPTFAFTTTWTSLPHSAARHELAALERELFLRADIVFTGGQSLHEAKYRQHRNIHLFASSIDASHFAQTRLSMIEPPDQSAIARPRLGFFGVIDERMDLDLVAARRSPGRSGSWS